MRDLVALLIVCPVFGSCASASQTQVTELEARIARLEASVSALQSRDSVAPSPGPIAAVAPSDPPPVPAAQRTSSLYPGEQTISDWLMTGVGAPDFTLASDAEAVRIEPKAAPTQRFVALVRTVPADGLVGKEITATFLVRADGLEKPGMCILKVQAEPALAYQGFLAGDFKEIAASTKGFVPCTVSTKVPDGARWILFGATYRGNGKIWVKSPALNPGAPKG